MFRNQMDHTYKKNITYREMVRSHVILGYIQTTKNATNKLSRFKSG